MLFVSLCFTVTVLEVVQALALCSDEVLASFCLTLCPCMSTDWALQGAWCFNPWLFLFACHWLTVAPWWKCSVMALTASDIFKHHTDMLTRIKTWFSPEGVKERSQFRFLKVLSKTPLVWFWWIREEGCLLLLTRCRGSSIIHQGCQVFFCCLCGVLYFIIFIMAQQS